MARAPTELTGKSLRIAGATIRVLPDAIVSAYPDGATSRFYPPVADGKFRRCAHMFGYTDALQYGIEHDVAHHLVAEAVGWPHSRVIWCEAHRRDWSLYNAEQRGEEEHLVNRMLRFINTGERDTDFGVLDARWGANLGHVARGMLGTLRPWLRIAA